MKSIRILLVDDHALVRAGIRSLLHQLPAVEVVAEAQDGRVALELVRRHQPNLVLMDVAMPNLNGLEATELITRQFPAVRVIILSMFANEEYVVHALRAGAAGYMLKNASPAELELAIHAVARGERYLTPAVSKTVIEDYLRRVSVDQSPLERLTPRQREILQLIAEGGTTKDIARRLGLSVRTVDTHRTQLMKELDIHDIAGLVRYAIRVGLVTPER
jgi:DNA-binding NarL/FixJ family response regulator